MKKLSIISLVILLNACHTNTGSTVVIKTGSSSAEVRTLLGEPERMQEFKLPETPFYGPQESLTGLVPPGTWLEEWVYAAGKEELYIWFAGKAEQSKDQWRVIATARYPVGAVY